jgi:hypothetical protein
MNADIWNVLHDGSVLRVSGAVPGNIQFAIWIDYLRDGFPDPGNRILLTLHDCTSLSFQPYEAETALTGLDAIARAEPEILQAHDWTDASTVDCVGGTLRVLATDFSLALDSGRRITFDDLCAVSEAYWTAFAERTPKTS